MVTLFPSMLPKGQQTECLSMHLAFHAPNPKRPTYHVLSLPAVTSLLSIIGVFLSVRLLKSHLSGYLLLFFRFPFHIAYLSLTSLTHVHSLSLYLQKRWENLHSGVEGIPSFSPLPLSPIITVSSSSSSSIPQYIPSSIILFISFSLPLPA